MDRHILICGERGVGKSTLIRRLLAESTLPVGGFVTRRLPQADGDGMFPIYLHAAALPPEAWRESLQEQKAAWVSRQLFTPQEAALLRPEDLLRFYTGTLGRRLLASPLVKREWSFNFRLSHEKETLLQGVMDCAFREGDGWVLLDYKTDRVEDPAAFVARYAPQLRLYAQALGEITALPVGEMWLYAVGNGQAYPVPPGDAPETDPGRFAGI